MPIIDLNCVDTCQEIAFLDETNQQILADANNQKWQFSYNWNSRKRTIELEFNNLEDIKIDSNLINETTLFINLYKEGIFVNKYKIKVYPKF